ncbi:hypothetical protein F0L68_28340 [Solihabitans fulvus]|uniref:GYD domain-containing protein n=1 Tax=Solihabitans fulvus TaxID=1892852 RepID=A0A5B2WY87_9PSEU|nr:hypothetical protein [Solihabitans fulvus]KAA2255476.1 hypothetical protein F0L68_28340 [Solihabitans fulvus]
MATYLMHEALPPYAWKAILEGEMDPHPLSDPQAMAAGFAAIGGTMQGLWLSAESCELVFVVDLPDTVDAVACSLRYIQRGQHGPIRITRLLTPQEGVAAIAKASGLPKSFKVSGSDG